MSRSLARRVSSVRSSPSGSWSVPLPSMIAIVLSLESKISSAPRSATTTAGREGRTRAKISVRSTSLHLGHLLLLEPQLSVDPRRVASYAETGHAKGVVRDSAVGGRSLAGRERLPPRRTTLARVRGSPVHHVRRALVRPEEEDLLLLVEVDDRLLDPGTLACVAASEQQISRRERTRKQQVDDAVHVLLEHETRRGAQVGQDHTLAPS